MGPLDLLIYAATRIGETGGPGLYRVVSEDTFHRFEPIPNQDFLWAEGFCRAWVRGGTEPSYYVRIPEGELFKKEVGPGIVRTFLRIPGKTKASVLDAYTVLWAVRFGQHGFEQLPLKGGKAIEREPESTIPARAPGASELSPLKPSSPPVAAKPGVSPVRPFVPSRPERPIVTSGRNAQASLFGPEPTPDPITGRLPDGTLPGQMSFID